jgi:hypothetical protein
MRDTMEMKFGSTLYEKIDASRMTESERREALIAMQNAEMIVDAVAWIAKKIEQAAAFLSRLFLRPSPKH